MYISTLKCATVNGTTMAQILDYVPLQIHMLKSRLHESEEKMRHGNYTKIWIGLSKLEKLFVT